jgi:predicted phage-related endonuclease|tara:strand:+ start:721 stop:1050 length:330 start_codon:yes stop_codon:yes gene_type:complete
MTPDQLELLSDMVADKVFTRFREYLEDNKGFLANFEPLGPEEFFNKNIDAFGNIKHGITPHLPSKKELLSIQLRDLQIKWKQLLKEEKYELLQELKEIYEKVKKEYDNL